MSSSSLERFQKRQKLKNSLTIFNHDIGDSEVNEFLNSNCDHEKVSNVYKKTEEFYDINVSHEEAEEFLIRFKQEYNATKCQDSFLRVYLPTASHIPKQSVQLL